MKYDSTIKALVGTFIIWFLINCIGFVIAWYAQNPTKHDEWSIKFKWGTFYINDVPKGFELGNTFTYLLLVGIFLVLLFNIRKRTKLKALHNNNP